MFDEGISPELPLDEGQAADSTPAEVPAEAPAEANVYEIDGNTYSADELRAWRDSGLRQDDYTRKTQELSAQRNDLAPLQQLRDYMAQDPNLVQYMQKYPGWQGQAAQAQTTQDTQAYDDLDPAVASRLQQQESELRNMSQMMQSVAQTTNQVQDWMATQQVTADLKDLAAQNEDVPEEIIGQVPAVLMALPGQPTSPQAMQMAVDHLMAQHRTQQAHKQGQEEQKAKERERRAMGGVSSGTRKGIHPQPDGKREPDPHFDKAFQDALADDSFTLDFS
jgi:hypothetical protein